MVTLVNIKQRIMLCAFICIYAFALIRPIMPIVNDVIAHTFFKVEHLATVHFENGKYHVHMDLQKADERNDARNTPLAPAFIDTLDSHLKSESITSFVITQTILPKLLFSVINFPVDVCLKSPTPPPKA
jgi:hypothetical protein